MDQAQNLAAIMVWFLFDKCKLTRSPSIFRKEVPVWFSAGTPDTIPQDFRQNMQPT